MMSGKLSTRKIIPEESKGAGKEIEVIQSASTTRKEYIMEIVNGTGMSLTLAVFTVYALFGDDIRLMAFYYEDDPVFFFISSIALGIFLVEFLMNVYAKPDYNFGFYFVLDLVSTFSLIPDIGWIWDALTSSGDEESQVAALKAGKASRAGTKAGKIVRIIRLVRMVRIVRLYKMKSKAEDEKVEEVSEPSKVGKILTELTTRRLILLVLCVVIVLPWIDNTLDSDYNEFQEYGLQGLHHMTQDYNATGTVGDNIARDMTWIYAANAGSLLELKIHGIDQSTSTQWLNQMRFQDYDLDAEDWVSTSEFKLPYHPITFWNASNGLIGNPEEKFRNTEYTEIRTSGCFDNKGQCTDCEGGNSECVSYAYFNTMSESRTAAATNMGKTLFIMIVLTVGVIAFTRDAETLVIGPIERMMALVNKLAENPLASTKTQKKLYDEDEEEHKDYETSMIEETLSKIGGLLQVGFGVAGTEIIAKNMGGAGELNVMIPGKKITSVFGFGIIEEFTEVCSSLEENIIMYINTIADIVHSDTNAYFGAANKNLGNAFLLTWKICDGSLPGLRDPRETGEDTMTPEMKAEQRKGIKMTGHGEGDHDRDIKPQELVDSALTAVLKIHVDVHNANLKPDGCFRQFIDDKRIVANTELSSSYEVHMGFGLHIGWAIEGAIGSRYKIDASYLSPNVNMSARLEAATGQFEVPMLLSEWFVNELSPSAKQLCRKIDRVCVKGSAIPMELWTFDVGTFPQKGFSPLIGHDGIQVGVDFSKDEIYRTLQEGINPLFFEKFNAGVAAYLGGSWMDAKALFEQVLSYREDGPTHVLLNVLKKSKYAAPSTWGGFRELTEK